MNKIVVISAMLTFFGGCGRTHEQERSIKSVVVNKTTVPVDAWKPDKPVLTKEARFFVNDHVVDGQSATSLTGGESTHVEIRLPDAIAEDLEGAFTINYLVLMPDGTPVTGNSIGVGEYERTDEGLVLRGEILVPAQKGAKWRLGAFCEDNRVIAYSEEFAVQ